MKEAHRSFAFSDDDMVAVIKTILWIIPFAAILIGISNIFLERDSIALVVFTIPIFSFVAYRLLLRGWVQVVIYSMIVLISAVITAAGFMGNGIHETAIIAFPVIVLLSSFLLNGKGVLISSGIVIFCLALMSFGEMYGLFPTRPIPSARIIDVVAICAILSVDIFLIYYLTSKTKNGLNQAIEEVEAQRAIQSRIEENLRLKTDLLREVHHRVKNNLSLINSLIDLEIIGNQGRKEDLHVLQRRIQAIARVHDPLYQSADYKEVDIKEYFERLIIGFSSALKIPDKLLEIRVASHPFSVHQAIPLGIILHELMSLVDTGQNQGLSINLLINNNEVHFSLNTGFADSKAPNTQEKMNLIALMSKELNGTLTIDHQKTTLAFDIESSE